MKIIKILFLLMILAGVFYVGFFFKADSNARATIFDLPPIIVDKMPAYLFREDSSSNPYKIIFNGNTTYMTVSKVSDSVSNILDFYEKQYPPKDLLKVKENLIKEMKQQQAKNNKQFINVINQINSIIDPVIQDPYFRWENENMGGLGMFQFSESLLEMGLDTFIHNYKKAIESGHFGKIGKARAVIVVKHGSQSTILNLWTTSDYNIHHTMAKPLQPQFNSLDIPAHQKSKTLLTMTQENCQTLDRITLCEWDLSVEEILEFYQTHLGANGWTSMTDITEFNGLFNHSIHFKRNARELILWIEKNNKTKTFICTLIDREQKQL